MARAPKDVPLTTRGGQHFLRLWARDPCLYTSIVCNLYHSSLLIEYTRANWSVPSNPSQLTMLYIHYTSSGIISHKPTLCVGRLISSKCLLSLSQSDKDVYYIVCIDKILHTKFQPIASYVECTHRVTRCTRLHFCVCSIHYFESILLGGEQVFL